MNILTLWAMRQISLPPLAPPTLMFASVSGPYSIDLAFELAPGVPGLFLERSVNGGGSWTTIAAVPRDDSGSMYPPGWAVWSDVTVPDTGYMYRAQSYDGAIRSVYTTVPGTLYSSVTPVGTQVYVDDLDPSSVIVEFPSVMNEFSGLSTSSYNIFNKTITGVSWADDTHLVLALSVPVVAGETLPDLELSGADGYIQYAGLLAGVSVPPFVSRITNNMVWTPVGDIYTVGAAGDYADLAAAFADINAGNITGDIELQLTTSQVLLAEASLSASGDGAASWTSLTIYPTAPDIVISGPDLATSDLIQIGIPGVEVVDNFIFDGRVNRSGSVDLTIEANNGGCLILQRGGSCEVVNINFICSSLFNSAVSVYAEFLGMVLVASNDINISGENCMYGITGSSTVNGALEISCNRVSGVFANSPTEAYADGIDTFGDQYTLIYGNSIFGPVAGITEFSSKFIGIYVGNSGAISAATVMRNYIGGSAPYCKGPSLSNSAVASMPAPVKNNFTGILIDNGADPTSLPTSVSYNTIQNIIWHIFEDTGFTEDPLFIGIHHHFNNVLANPSDTFSITYNNIGSQYTADNINVIGEFGGADTSFYGILYDSAIAASISYNTVGGITTSNVSATRPTNITGIRTNNGSMPFATITYNTIGGNVENSLQWSSINGNEAVIGISTAVTAGGTPTIGYNTVRNLTNLSTFPTTFTKTIGIYAERASITYNNVYNLLSRNGNTNTTNGPSVGGIIGAGNPVNVISATNNSVYSIANTNPAFAASAAVGIYANGRSSGSLVNNITNNFIQSVSNGNPNGLTYGIKLGDTGATRCTNNIISIGGDIGTQPGTIYGIYESTPNPVQNAKTVAYNTVLVSGTGYPVRKSYCFWSLNGFNARIYKDNIFYNSRTTTNPGPNPLHYAMWLDDTNPGTIDWNHYLATGDGGMLVRYGATDYNVLPFGGPGTGHDNDISLPITFRSDVSGADAFRLASGLTAGNNTSVNVSTDYAGSQRIQFSKGAFETQLVPTLYTTTTVVNNGRIDFAWRTQDPASDSVSIERRDVLPAPGAYAEIGTWPTGIGVTTFNDTTAVPGILYEYRVTEIDNGGMVGGPSSGGYGAIAASQVNTYAAAGKDIAFNTDMSKVIIQGQQMFETDAAVSIDTAWLSIAGKTISNAVYAFGQIELTVTVPFNVGEEIPDLVYTKPITTDGIRFYSSKWNAGCSYEAFCDSFTVTPVNVFPIVSAVVENAAPSDVVVTYGAALDADPANIPTPGDNRVFITVNGNPATITGITTLGAVLTCTLDTPVANGDTVQFSYQPFSALGDLLYLVSGNTVPSESNHPVTNNVV